LSRVGGLYGIRNWLATVSASLNKYPNSEQSCVVTAVHVNAFIGSRRELVANCVHNADANATQLDSCVASASAVCVLEITHRQNQRDGVCGTGVQGQQSVLLVRFLVKGYCQASVQNAAIAHYM